MRAPREVPSAPTVSTIIGPRLEVCSVRRAVEGIGAINVFLVSPAIVETTKVKRETRTGAYRVQKERFPNLVWRAQKQNTTESMRFCPRTVLHNNAP
jgi:hypothetical protein